MSIERLFRSTRGSATALSSFPIPSRHRMFSVAAAQLVANFCEALFYGIYLITCSFCIPTLFMKGDKDTKEWRHPRELHWVMVIVFLVLFVICTFDAYIGYAHVFNAFVQSPNSEEAFLNGLDWINVTRSITRGAILVVGDFLLIYRCWIVYGRRWPIIVLPTILFIGTISVLCKQIAAYTSLRMTSKGPTLDIPMNNRTAPWWTAIYAISAVQSVLSSSILIWRIWAVERLIERNALSDHPPRHLRKVMRVIGESGAAYTTILAVCAFLVAWRENGVYLVANIALQSGGIAFNVIIARCSVQRDQQFESYDRSGRSTICFAGDSTLETNFSSL